MKKFAAGFLIMIATSNPSYAYVDPGSGAFLLQILAAIGVGALFYMRKAREFVKQLFTRRKRKDR
jgi:hypothetical protein|tara:strand:+ start:2511 stop:2705 length:195 start_codon:yes stop_codon:yes gene_type:complete